MEKLGGRKAVGTIVVISVGAAIELLVSGGLSSNMLMLLLTSLGIYTAGNVGEHISKKHVKQTSELTVVADAIDAQTHGLNQMQQYLNTIMEQGTMVSNATKMLMKEQEKVTKISTMLAKRANL